MEVHGEEVDGGSARTFVASASTTMHVVRVAGLSAASRYGYLVRLAGAIVDRGVFTTAPRAGEGRPLKFLVYGDDRSNPVAHAAVVRALLAAPSDFLVNTGDLVEDGGLAADWQTFFDVERPLIRDRALFVSIGNHELYGDSAGANFARYFGFYDGRAAAHVFGTVRLSNVRFFFLNATHDWESGEERRWLDGELARADDEPGLVWRVAVVHQGPWSSGPHGANADLVSAHVPELLETHKVDLVLSGHDHIYERGASGPLKYIVSGGGGAPLYRIAAPIESSRKAESTYHFIEVATGRDAVRIVARRLDGSVLDWCGFAKGLPWDCDPPGPSGVRGSGPASAPAVARRSAESGPATPRCGCAVVGALDEHPAVGVAIALACVLGAAARRRCRQDDLNGALGGRP